LPYLPQSVAYIKGQLERGRVGEDGYLHWQVFVLFERNVRLGHVRRVFGDCHAEPTRSAASEDYVWKEDTRVDGTQFELGKKPFKRNSKQDWDQVWESATRGDLANVPADVRIRYYRTLRSIAADHAIAPAIVRQTFVFWGPTGTGKSRTAWDRAGVAAYCKDPRTKWWCGYQGQSVIVIDEFRGTIDISHLLRWLDRYPVLVEIKGSSVPLMAETFYITSNLHPNDWYPDLDELTKLALDRKRVV
jgi:hypothetical protein